ncbi:hypothetical protein GGQ13_003016 [Salinibacter ruber]|nr:hypothetical protein [Salinibacter ruber]
MLSRRSELTDEQFERIETVPVEVESRVCPCNDH